MITVRLSIRQTLLLAAWLISPALLSAQTTLTYPPAPVPIDQVAAKMKVPDGFRVTLFAGEPDVVQPIAFTFDDRGRMWVAECLSYPKWTKDGTGRDRIVILEDTDGDGVHDKRKVFADNLANLSGLEYGFGGVFICSLPTLKFIPDRNGDDIPDGPAETVLDGWDENCRHNVFNGLAWGPDGWLYGLNGILSRSLVGPPGAPPEKRKYIDCGVWRYHPTRRDFEPFAFGTTNPWGLDWDDYGEMFITNCVIKHLFHVVPGGHYERMFGADPNPHAYGLMQSCADHIHWAGGHWTDSRGAVGAHSDAGGGHAHSGCSVYLGDNFPEKYRNNVFMCNIHGNRLNRDRLERKGSSYVAHHEKDFLFANDPWHRGLVVKYGPDGGLYVADWCDTGECHNYEVADVTNGRIVKVMYDGGTRLPFRSPLNQPFDLAKQSDAELVALALHRNDWIVRHARRLLQERAAAGSLQGDTTERLRKLFREQQDETRKLRALWALYAVAPDDDDSLLAALQSGLENVTAWGVTLSLDHRHDFQGREKIGREFLRLASPRLGGGGGAGGGGVGGAGVVIRGDVVRRHLASAVTRLKPDDPFRVDVTFNLLKRRSDSATALMNWYAAEGLITADRKPPAQGIAVEMLNMGVGFSNFIARRAVLKAAQETPGGLTALLNELVRIAEENAKVNSVRGADVLDGIAAALQGKRNIAAPPNWFACYKTFSESGFTNNISSARRLAVLFGDKYVLDQLRAVALDSRSKTVERQEALGLLVDHRSKTLPPTLIALLDDDALRGDALRGLAAFDDPTAAEAVLARFAKLNDAEKTDALQTLASRPSYGLALLDAVEAGRIDRRDVPTGVAVQLAGLKNKTVAERLATVWGTVRPTSEARKQQAVRLKQVLSPAAVAAADAKHGRALFTKSCAACHKLFGEGGKIGPELTGSQRANVDYVLENVLDPSAKVGRLYQVTILELADGRVVQGVVTEENDLSLTVQTANEQLVIAKSEIDQRQQTPLSLMPDGLFDKLNDEEIRDLMAYLASNVQ